MIPAAICVLLPVLGGCSNYIDNVPSVATLVRNRTSYDRQTVDVPGRVTRLRQWSSGGYRYQIFYLCAERDCVHVFMEDFSPIRNGERVTVRGRYAREIRTAKAIYRNEIEATEIQPAE